MSRPFQFGLESVRRVRERAEDQAGEDLAVALAERSRRAARLAEAAGRLDEARLAHRRAAQAGVSVLELQAHQAFVEASERAAQAAELELHRQDAEVSARRAALQDAARERQVLENLRDKQATAFHRLAERRESARLDELALARHRRGAPA